MPRRGRKATSLSEKTYTRPSPNEPTAKRSQHMHEKSIELLNKAVADEITALHQYMFFHFHCDDQGFDLLAALFKRTAIEEMMHVELLADRILFLKGELELKASAAVKKVTDVGDMLKMARQMEEESAADYNRWANECSANADSVSKKLFEQLVIDEERHYDQYDNELDNLERFGKEYLALQSIERSKARGGKGGAGAE
jgi:bacterioferritin